MNAQTLAKQTQTIFSLPEAAVRINQVLNAPEPDIAELEEIIMHDPALTAKLLKIVNSSFYGLGSKVDSISGAVMMLGLQEIRNLVLEVSVANEFENIPGDLVDMTDFWYHSIVKGVLASLLAKHLQFKNHQRFYIAGLLGSIGKLILFAQYPEKAKQILGLQDQSDAAILAEEKRLFGFDYAEFGAELLKEWKLPEEIWQMVFYQFQPMHENAPKTDACILHIAAKISNTVQPCRNQSYELNAQKPDFDAGVLDYLQLTPDVIQSATSEALVYPWEILGIIYPNAMSIY